jgi:hypothetical protein
MDNLLAVDELLDIIITKYESLKFLSTFIYDNELRILKWFFNVWKDNNGNSSKFIYFIKRSKYVLCRKITVARILSKYEIIFNYIRSYLLKNPNFIYGRIINIYVDIITELNFEYFNELLNDSTNKRVIENIYDISSGYEDNIIKNTLNINKLFSELIGNN